MQPVNVPVFRTDANTVSVDVAVLDNKDRFIPKMTKSNFRILEDNVPQQVASYLAGRSADDRLHGDRVLQPLPIVLFADVVPDA